MNEKLKKEKEVVSKKEKWVNEKIKIELEYEKAQVGKFIVYCPSLFNLYDIVFILLRVYLYISMIMMMHDRYMCTSAQLTGV